METTQTPTAEPADSKKTKDQSDETVYKTAESTAFDHSIPDPNMTPIADRYTKGEFRDYGDDTPMDGSDVVVDQDPAWGITIGTRSFDELDDSGQSEAHRSASARRKLMAVSAQQDIVMEQNAAGLSSDRESVLSHDITSANDTSTPLPIPSRTAASIEQASEDVGTAADDGGVIENGNDTDVSAVTAPNTTPGQSEPMRPMSVQEERDYNKSRLPHRFSSSISIFGAKACKLHKSDRNSPAHSPMAPQSLLTARNSITALSPGASASPVAVRSPAYADTGNETVSETSRDNGTETTLHTSSEHVHESGFDTTQAPGSAVETGNDAGAVSAGTAVGETAGIEIEPKHDPQDLVPAKSPNSESEVALRSRASSRRRREQWKAAALYTLGALLLVSLAINIVQAVVFPVEVPTLRSSEVFDKSHPAIKSLLKDRRLKKMFYGLNYSPNNVLPGQCGVTQREVSQDIALMSQLTDRIRLYGTSCRQAEMVLEAIQTLEVPMTVSVGLWLNQHIDTSLQQLADFRRILDKYPARLIDSILVGNEVLLRQELSPGELIGYMEFVREHVERQGLKIPVGTSEIGSRWTQELVNHSEIMAINIHPFFGGVPVNMSTLWTYDFLLEEVVTKLSVHNSSTARIVISEVGWPSSGPNLQGAVPGTLQLQQFLDTWVCSNRNSEVGWYWFEAFDGPWKQQLVSGDLQEWESHWGLFDKDRRLKNITIPSC